MTGDQLNQFHRDLSSVVQAGIKLPLFDSKKRLSLPRTLQLLDANRKQMEILVERGGVGGEKSDLRTAEKTNAAEPDGGELPLENAGIERSVPGISSRYLAALQVYLITGDMRAVLTGLTCQQLAISQIKRSLRWPLFYLACVVVLALVGFVLFQQYWMPIVAEFRQETKLKSSILSGTLDYQVFRTIAVGMAFATLIMILLMGLFRGFNRLVMWLGGRKYIRSQVAVETGRTMRVLLAQGIEPERALALASSLTGLDEPTQKSLFPHAGLSQQDRDWIGWTQLWSNNAQRHLEQVRFAIPSLMTLLVGGFVLLGYSLMIYGTILLIYNDLLGDFQ